MRKAIKKVAPKKATNTLPKKANGGKTGTKSVASAGAKKATTTAGNKAVASLNNQGKPGSTKKLLKGEEYDSKGRVVSKYDVSGSKGKIYDASLGSVTRYTSDIKNKNFSMSDLDTTGFSAGKRTFEKTTRSGDAGDKKRTTTKTTVKRSAVPSTIKKMQSFKKGGKK